jgi:hypothetical protein
MQEEIERELEEMEERSPKKKKRTTTKKYRDD